MEPKPVRNKVKKSLLMRIKIVIIDDDSIAPPTPKRNASDPVLSYIAIADKDGAVLPAMLSSMLGGAAEDRGEHCGSRRKRGWNRWQALRTAMNGTTLMRRVISRRKANKEKLSSSRSTNNLEETSGKISNPTCKITRRASSTASSASGCSYPLITSSSSPSSSNSSVRADHVSSTSSTHETHSPPPSTPLNNGTGATKQKQCGVEDRKKGHHGSNTALYCTLSISLLVLILWGRFPAILCTSFLFYIVRPSRRKPCNEGDLCGECELDDSVQNNKNKIVMERKLESTRSHVYLASFGGQGV